MRPWFDMQRYQAQIDERVGLNKDGKSIIVLRWAQDVTTTAFGQTTPRYWTKRKRNSDGTYTYWKVARFVFEKRLEPEQYVPSWDAQRFSTIDPESNAPVDRGPAPEEYFTFAWLCAEHELHTTEQNNGWPPCCNRAYYADTKWGGPRSRCWGTYRPPSSMDLELISQAVRQMEAEKFRDPYRPLTAAELAEAEIAANMQAERADEQLQLREQEMHREFTRLHAWRLFETDPGRLAHGRYHFMRDTYQRTESGLLMPVD